MVDHSKLIRAVTRLPSVCIFRFFMIKSYRGGPYLGLIDYAAPERALPDGRHDPFYAKNNHNFTLSG